MFLASYGLYFGVGYIVTTVGYFVREMFATRNIVRREHQSHNALRKFCSNQTNTDEFDIICPYTQNAPDYDYYGIWREMTIKRTPWCYGYNCGDWETLLKVTLIVLVVVASGFFKKRKSFNFRMIKNEPVVVD